MPHSVGRFDGRDVILEMLQNHQAALPLPTLLLLPSLKLSRNIIQSIGSTVVELLVRRRFLQSN